MKLLRVVHVWCVRTARNLHIDRSAYSKAKSVESQLDVDQSLIRNVGVVAHIDAGKTTVTERLLYLAGVTRFMGNVDLGNTVTDFMDLERERGITIQSAAISFMWLNKRINLIDTPGHVDFTLEVERCLRVMDGVLTVLDASAGVQAQTLTVWRQARKFQLPSLFFINKMDKFNADFSKSIDSITEKLGLENVIPICVPVIDDQKRFIGVLDLIKRRHLNCQLGDKARWNEVDNKSPQYFFSMYEQMMRAREEILSRLADVDENFADYLLKSDENDSRLNTELMTSLRRSTLSQLVVPIACGSALRCAQTLTPVLDLMVNTLPAPNERNRFVSEIFRDDLSALVFKIRHEKRYGQLTYVRVYTGDLRNLGAIHNANHNCSETRFNVYIPHSDQLQVTQSVKAGNIAVLTGLKSTVTGDTLVENKNSLKKAIQRQKEFEKQHSHNSVYRNFFRKVNDDVENHSTKSVLLADIDTPDPVYFCSVDPPSDASNIKFEQALKELTIEDPSLRVRCDTETGQMVIEAMGELHIEVVKERLRRDYNLDVFMGPLQVAYREVIDAQVSNTAAVHDFIGESAMKHQCMLSFTLYPRPNTDKFKKVTVLLNEDSPYAGAGIREDWMNAINEGCMNALHNGPVAGFVVYDVEVVLTEFLASGGRLSPAIVAAAASKCVSGALEKADAHLMEPVMNVEISSFSRAHVDSILQEMHKRRASIKNTESDDVLNAKMPLAELKDFAKNIRIMTSGNAVIHIEFDRYYSVTEQQRKVLLDAARSDSIPSDR